MAARKTPTTKASKDAEINRNKKAYELLVQIIDKVDEDMYESLCYSGQDLIKEGCQLVGSKKFVAGRAYINVDSFEVDFKDVEEDDNLDIEVKVTNSRTGETVTTKDVYASVENVERSYE